MANYHGHFGTRKTPQSEPIPGTDQIENSAGGFVWQVDDWTLLDRFLILGTVGGTYYIEERELTITSAEAVVRCIKEDGLRVVERIREISEAGRAAKNDPALFALAMCSSPDLADLETRRAAMAALPSVARIGTHLFTFLTYVKSFGGWRRSLRRGIANWYLDKEPERLAYQLVKYRRRGKWSHHDVLNLAHPKPVISAHDRLFKWVVDGEAHDEILEIPIVQGFLEVQKAETPAEAAKIIVKYNLPREAVPTEFLTEKEVWAALLENMPMTAMIRNLGNMSKIGLLIPGSWDVIGKVVDQLGDVERLRKARVHPIQVLAALLTYQRGRGVLGRGEWDPVPQVIGALDAAFYESFGNIERTGKRWLLGLDVSGSMSSAISALPMMSCAQGTAAMAMVTVRTEGFYHLLAFSDVLKQFPVAPTATLNEVVSLATMMNFGRTDCALPMLYAAQNGIEVDQFVIYTDSETWYGDIHPVQALQEYRQKSGIPAKLAVVAMASNPFSIADPNDPGMMDFVGFDTNTPQALSKFVLM